MSHISNTESELHAQYPNLPPALPVEEMDQYVVELDRPLADEEASDLVSDDPKPVIEAQILAQMMLTGINATEAAILILEWDLYQKYFTTPIGADELERRIARQLKVPVAQVRQTLKEVPIRFRTQLREMGLPPFQAKQVTNQLDATL